jgi:hypothetical protein
MLDYLTNTIQAEISEAFFASQSPFGVLGNQRGTFGHYIIQSIVEYTIPQANSLKDLSYKEWGILLDQFNGRKDTKR